MNAFELAKRALFAMFIAAAPTSADVPRRELQLVDFTDDYERIWNETQKQPEAQRVAYFKGAWARVLPGFYDAKRMELFGVTPAQYDEFLAKAIAAYPKNRDKVRVVASEFRTLFTPAKRSFEQAFGPMRGYPPIYLVNSHNEFDGGTRDLPEGNRLLFGADVIARLYQDKPIQPFFHHELFHLLHGRTFQDCQRLWCNLWTEGLATYVAAKLNPGASDEALLLTSPRPLRAAVESNRREAVCVILARFDSEKSEDYGPIFTGGAKPLSDNLPPRFGYYVGYLVARDLGRPRTLKQLAILSREQARPLVEASLRRMADCPAAERG